MAANFTDTTKGKIGKLDSITDLQINVSTKGIVDSTLLANHSTSSPSTSNIDGYDVTMGDEEDFELIPDDTDVSEESSFLTEEQINDYLEYIGKDKKQVIKEFLEFRPDVQVAYETLAELDPELLKELENTIIEQAYYTAQLQNIKDDILSKAKTPEDKKRLKDETADERHKLTEAYKTAIFKISDDFVKKYGATSEARKKFLEAKSTGSSSEDVPSNIDVQGEGGITVPDPAPSEYVEEEIILEDDEDELEEVIEPDDDIEIEIPIDIDDDEDEEIIVVDDDSTLGDAPASIELGNIDCQNFFDTYSDGMYGSNQRVFREMCIYIYNGVEYEYRQIMKIVNDAVAKGNPIPKITVKYDAKYLELINKLVSKGFTEAEAFIILESIDDQGACSYATTADNIFYFYRNNPEQFEKDFGYPMYTTIDGKTVLNSPELLLDLWLYANDEANGGKFVSGNHLVQSMLTDRVDIYGNNMLDTSQQTYLATGSTGINDKVIEGFLQSKNSGITFGSKTIINNINCSPLSNSELDSIIEQMKEALNNNNSLRISIYYVEESRPHIFHLNADDPSESTTWANKGHSMAVTGITSTGIIVSNKGKKYEIPFSDLTSGGSFILYSSSLNF